MAGAAPVTSTALAHECRSAADASDGCTQPANPTRVVVLSHDHSLLALMRAVLPELGLEVYTDEIRPRITDVIARVHPAAVTMDVQLGHEVSAWELVVALGHSPRTRTTPVIACAAARWILDKQAPFIERHHLRTWTARHDLADLLVMVGAVV